MSHALIQHLVASLRQRGQEPDPWKTEYECHDRVIAFNRAHVMIAGSVSGAVFLGQAVYWSKRSQLRDGWFFKTQAEWLDETGIKQEEQVAIRKRLKAVGVLEEQRHGLPARLWFRVRFSRLYQAMRPESSIPAIQDSSLPVNGDTGVPVNGEPVIPSEPEITSETTKLSGSVEQNPLADASQPAPAKSNGCGRNGKSDPNVKAVIDHWFQSFKAKTGKPPIPNGGMWGKKAKDLLHGRSLQDALGLIDEAFARPTKFCGEKGLYGLEHIVQSVNQILVRRAEENGQ